MTRTLITFFSATLLALSSFAQTAVIKGKVVDANTKEPISYATITVKDSQGEFAGGNITNETGFFQVDKLKNGNYTVTVTLLGYKESKRSINLQKELLNMGTISIEEDAQMLEEAQVTGQQSTLKFDIDKRIFSVGSDLASKGASASEILENIPSIEVDQDGTVSLRGSSSVTIWINGKPSGLTADNQGDILEQMPADNIERVEVITNPGAKFSAEGTAGIINIILKDDARNGYYGSVSAGGNALLSKDKQQLSGWRANGNINFNAGHWNGYASLGYRSNNRVNGSQTDRSYDDGSYLNQTGSGSGDHSNIFVRAGLGYKFSKKDEIGIGGMGMFGNGKNTSTTLYNSTVPSFTATQRISTNTDRMRGGNGEFTYKHTFKEDHTLEALVNYSRWGSDGSTIYEQLYSPGIDPAYQSQKSQIGPNNWTFQLDYSNKLNETMKVEAGYKGELQQEDSPIETYTDNEFIKPDTSLFNDFIIKQWVHAVYASWSHKIDNFGYQVGLRGEYTDLKTKSLGYDAASTFEPADKVKGYSNNYFKLFPTVFLTYRASEADELQLNYTRRIRRPFGGQLNNFKNITDSTNISYGNPKLEPQYTNSVEFNYIHNWNQMEHMLSASVYYHGDENMMQRISYLDGSIMKSTFANVGTATSIGGEIVGKNHFGNWLDLTTTVNLYYYRLNAYDYVPDGTTTHIKGNAQNTFNWNARMIANFTLPAMWSIQLRGDYRARTVVVQGYREPGYRIDLGVRKSFKNNLSLNLNVRDALDSFRFRTHTEGQGYTQNEQHWHGGRSIRLTLSYSFGNMKPIMKKDKPGEDGGDGDDTDMSSSYNGGE